MTRQVEPRLKDRVDCPCGCGVYGMPTKKLGHPRGCSCRPCLNGRSSRKGKAAHRRIARELGAATPGYGVSSHEESWTHAFRLEVKSGAQAGPVVTKFKNSRNQSEASRAIGDHRPFAAVYDSCRKGDPIVVSIDLETFKAMTLVCQEVPVSEYTRLRELAEQAERYDRDWTLPRDTPERYLDASGPAVVLGLLDELEAARHVADAAERLAWVLGVGGNGEGWTIADALEPLTDALGVWRTTKETK